MSKSVVIETDKYKLCLIRNRHMYYYSNRNQKLYSNELNLTEITLYTY